MSFYCGSVKPLYESPQACVVEMTQDALLCSSPVPGGNEGLIYEDWGNGGN